jgi:hypothetical protein
MILTVLDARAIQEYIYGSNRLKDNVGASQLADAALSAWACETMQHCFSGRCNPATGRAPDPTRSLLSDSALDAELFYAGGGNAVFLFRNLPGAHTFAREYSKRLLQNAPNLSVACVHHAVQGNLAAALQEALMELAQRKAAPRAHTALLGLGVTLDCAITRRPANTLDRSGTLDEQPVSSEVAIKRSDAVLAAARSRIETYVPRLQETITLANGVPCGPFGFPLSFDDLGRSRGDTSYIGVIHIDGNGMGDKFSEIIGRYSAAGDDPAFIAEMRELSIAVDRAGKEAVATAVNGVLDALSSEDGDLVVARTVPIQQKDGLTLLPLRFLVYGGDDITLVCDGRLALDLAERMLLAFEREEPRLTACAGVAIVKSHHPFFRAYELADALCASAKRFRRDKLGGAEVSVLDWHLTAGGVETDIETIRKHQYRTPGGQSLTLRPYVATQSSNPAPGREWSGLRKDILDVWKDPKGAWAERRRQLKETLAGALRLGAEATQAEVAKLQIKGLKLPGAARWSGTGFYASETPYLDALELLDLVPRSSDWTLTPEEEA